MVLLATVVVGISKHVFAGIQNLLKAEETDAALPKAAFGIACW